jgi:hypothetical protein
VTDERPIPALRPAASPQELREWTVEDYTVMARAMGLPSDRETIERQAVSDLSLYDAIQREDYRTPPSAPSPEKQAEERQSRAQNLDVHMAEKHGAQVMRGDEKVVSQRGKIMHATSAPTDRWSNAKARVFRICQGRTNHPDPVVATSTCEMPKLALALFKIQAFVITRHVPPWKLPPGSEANPFFGLKPDEYMKKMQRMIEDVCDKSTGRMGPWHVPK